MNGHSDTPNNYFTLQKFQTEFGNVTIKTISKSGIDNWNLVTPSQELIAECVSVKPDNRVLYLGYGHAVSLAYLAIIYPDSFIFAIDHNSIAVEAAKLTILENQITNIQLVNETSHFPNRENFFDVVVLDIPKGRELSRRWLMEGFHCLKTEGKFFVSGSNNGGIRSITDDVGSLFHNNTTLGYKKGNRIIAASNKKAINELPDWSNQAGIAPYTWKEVEFSYLESKYLLFTLPGVFSSDHLDQGTRFLLDHVVINSGGKILDFGCGWGAIGLVAAQVGARKVDLIDNNLLAINCSVKNCLKLNICNARIVPSDILRAVLTEEYDQILSNPPFHVGREVDYSVTNVFIKQSHQILKPTGKLVFVANEFIRYDRFLKQVYPRVECLAADQHFRIWQAEKS